MKIKGLIIPVGIIVIVLLFFPPFYTIDETQQVVITQFGEPIGDPIKAPGLHFKWPWRTANKFAKNLLEWDGDPGQIPTLDKTFIWVDTFARWKIVDPLTFFRTAINEDNAQARLDDIIDAAVRNFITSYPLIETVRRTDRELEIATVGQGETVEKLYLGAVTMGRGKITKGIMDQVQPKLEKFGIQIVDVKIKRLNYVEQVQKSVYARMIAERNQIAEKFRSEGKGEARKIEGDQEKDLKQITSEAYRKAQEIKGKADGKATLIYAEAFGRDPDFYSFVKTLDIYKEAMDKNSALILSTDSEFLKYFKGYKGYEGGN